MELELRMCLLFGVNDLKKIVEKDLKEFKKSHQSNGNAVKKWVICIVMMILIWGKFIIQGTKRVNTRLAMTLPFHKVTGAKDIWIHSFPAPVGRNCRPDRASS